MVNASNIMSYLVLTLALLFFGGCGGQISGSADCASPITITEGEYAKWSVEAENKIWYVELNALSSDSFTLTFDDTSNVQYNFQLGGYCEYFRAEVAEVNSAPESLIVYDGSNPSRLIASEFLYGVDNNQDTDENSNLDGGPVPQPQIETDCNSASNDERRCLGSFELDGKAFEWEQRRSLNSELPASGLTYFEVRHLGESIFTMSLVEWNGL